MIKTYPNNSNTLYHYMDTRQIEDSSNCEYQETKTDFSFYRSDKRETRDRRLNLIIPPSLHKLMRKQAEAEKISINELSIRAFVQYLEKAKK